MAATSSLPPLPSPTTPSSPFSPPTPTARKLKTKFINRHAQEGGGLSHAPPPPQLQPPLELTQVRSLTPQRLNTTPPPKKRFCPWDWNAAPPHVNPPSPPQSPAPHSPSPRGITTIPPLTPIPTHTYRREHTPYPPTTPPYTHIPPHGLDLSVRGGVGPGGVTWHAPYPSRPPHSFPPPYIPHHHHHHHHRRRFSHYPFYTGSPSQIMLSEAVMSRGQQDASLLASTPTAPRKSFDMDTTQHGTSEYKTKSMVHWTYDDIVQFFMDSPWGMQLKDMEFNFSAISGATGPELMRFPLSKFKEFSPKYGDDIYKYMQRKVASERERERAEAHHYSPTILSPPSSYSIPSPSLSTSTTSPFSPTIDMRSPLLHPQPLVCDAPARYEVRYEPPPQPRPRYHTGGGDPYGVPPTAAGKSLSLLPPPLVRMERREQEERREGSDGGEGRSGESSQPREEEAKVEPPKKRGPGRPRKPENELKKKKKKTGRLWEFIRNLLLNPETCPSLVKWENVEERTFRFVDAEKVARMWGDRKQNREMNYEKLSRAMRYYYKTHIFEAVIGRRLVYKFGKNAKGIPPQNSNFPDVHHNLTHHEPPPPPQPPPIHSPLNDTHPDITPHHSDTPQLHHDTHIHHSEPHHHHHHHQESHTQYHSESPPPQMLHQGNASPPLLHHFHHPHLSLPHQLQPHTS